jgi:hypothetical protein
MKKSLVSPFVFVIFLGVLGLTPLVLAQFNETQDPPVAAEQTESQFFHRSDLTFTLDNACDARTSRTNRVNPAATTGMRGDTSIINGKLFRGWVLPLGFDGAFNLDANVANSVGTWRCIQTTLNDPAPGNTELPLTGAVTYYFELEGGMLMVQGLNSHRNPANGGVPRVHAIVGGTGRYKAARGEVREEVIGNNNTGAFNLRFTLRIKRESLR